MELVRDDIYQVYLLRLWRERPATPERPAVWRCSVEDTRTGQRRGFGSLEEAVEFLRLRVQEADQCGVNLQSEKE